MAVDLSFNRSFGMALANKPAHESKTAMKKTRNPLCSSRDGAAVVEFAMVLPIFVFIMLMLIELSNLSMAKNVMLNEAREAVRLAISSNADYADVEAFARNRVVSILNVSPGDVEFSITGWSKTGVERPSMSAVTKGDYVTIRVDVPYSKIAIFAGGVLTDTTTGQCTMQKE